MHYFKEEIKMRNIFMILTTLLILTACADDSSNKGSSIDTTPPPTTTTPTVSVKSYVSIIRNTDNSHGDYCINGVSKAAGDTVNITFQNPADESIYTITKGYIFDNSYCFSITSNLKDVSMAALNIIVKNRNGVEILNSSEVLLLTLNKYFPYDPANKIPLPNLFDFTTEKTKVIVLNQLENEYYYNYRDNYKGGMFLSTRANVSSYSFTSTPSGNLGNNNTDGNFTVDDTTATFMVGSTSYQNCLVSKTTTPCAISVTHSGTGAASASFYIRLDRSTTYPDTKLDFTSK